MSDRRDPGSDGGDGTTGHEWDGIRELNNPLPRWWLWTFYACVLFAAGYTIAYPAWPGSSAASKGLLGWSSRADLAASVDAAAAGKGEWLETIADSDMTAILALPELARFATAGGASAFKVYCVQCHGSDAAGGKGYPNLNDDDWIWGGQPDEIYATLLHGVRSPSDPDTRFSEMPAFGLDQMLDRGQIDDVAWFVRRAAGLESDASGADRGALVYADNCAACHGDRAEGNSETGSPALADAIWLYGSEHPQIAAQVTSPAHGVMPAWGARLSQTTVKQLAAYVHSLGGGE